MGMFSFTPSCCCGDPLTPCFLGYDNFNRLAIGTGLPNAAATGLDINLISGGPPMTYTFIGNANNWVMESGTLRVSGANSYISPNVQHPDGLYNVMLALSGYHGNSGDSLVFGFNYTGSLQNYNYIEYYWPIEQICQVRFHDVNGGVDSIVQEDIIVTTTGYTVNQYEENFAPQDYNKYRWFLGGVTDMYASTFYRGVDGYIPSVWSTGMSWNPSVCQGEISQHCFKPGLPRLFGGIYGRFMYHENLVNFNHVSKYIGQDDIPALFDSSTTRTRGSIYTRNPPEATGGPYRVRSLITYPDVGMPDRFSIPLVSTGTIATGFFFGVGSSNNVMVFSGGLGVARTMALADTTYSGNGFLGFQPTGWAYNIHESGPSSGYDNLQSPTDETMNFPCPWLQDTLVPTENEPDSVFQSPLVRSAYGGQLSNSGLWSVTVTNGTVSGRLNEWDYMFSGSTASMQTKAFHNPTIHGGQAFECATSTGTFVKNPNSPVSYDAMVGLEMTATYGYNTVGAEYFTVTVNFIDLIRATMTLTSSLAGTLATRTFIYQNSSTFCALPHIDISAANGIVSARLMSMAYSAGSYGTGGQYLYNNYKGTITTSPALAQAIPIAQISIARELPMDFCRRISKLDVSHPGTNRIRASIFPTVRAAELNAELGSPYLGRLNASHIEWPVSYAAIKRYYVSGVPQTLEENATRLPSNLNTGVGAPYIYTGYYSASFGQGLTKSHLYMSEYVRSVWSPNTQINGFTDINGTNAELMTRTLDGKVVGSVPHPKTHLGNTPASIFITFEGGILNPTTCPSGIVMSDEIIDFLNGGEYEIPLLQHSFTGGGPLNGETVTYEGSYYRGIEGLYCKTTGIPAQYSTLPPIPGIVTTSPSGGIVVRIAFDFTKPQDGARGLYNAVMPSSQIVGAAHLDGRVENYSFTTTRHSRFTWKDEQGTNYLYDAGISVSVSYYAVETGCGFPNNSGYGYICGPTTLTWLPSFPTSWRPILPGDFVDANGKGYVPTHGVIYDNPHRITVRGTGINNTTIVGTFVTGTALDSYAGFTSSPNQYGISGFLNFLPMRLFPNVPRCGWDTPNIRHYGEVCSFTHPFGAQYAAADVKPLCTSWEPGAGGLGEQRTIPYMENASCVQIKTTSPSNPNGTPASGLLHYGPNRVPGMNADSILPTIVISF